MNSAEVETTDQGPWTKDHGLVKPLSEVTRSTVHGLWSAVLSLITLTKPTIVLSFTLTGAAALVMEGSLLANPERFFMVTLAMLLTAASANGLNQYLERDLDAQMERTRKRRPLPQGKIHPNMALGFSLLLGVLAVAILGIWFNLLSVWLAFGTIAFYIFCYTLWLKPRTHYNIVIGGAAGATAPLIAWAAATGHLSAAAWILFLIIFTWTPPHFWALALCVKDQYAKAGIPMMPVTKGLERTRQEILWYCILLVPLSLSLYPLDLAGLFYFAGAFILGMLLLGLAFKLKAQRTQRAAFSLFRYSILYLMLLFILLMIDSKVILENKFIT
ncbi:MAG: protoheme IX farnesyltransferase [Deltaproteobacteria bacterium]|nr:protoheme IX farnesyltransferase [Deltaproteobacteria bacterium]